MGTFYSLITLTNTSSSACLVQGYGGVSYVAGRDREQVGAPATRDTSVTARSVVLQPGERAAARLGEGTAFN